MHPYLLLGAAERCFIQLAADTLLVYLTTKRHTAFPKNLHHPKPAFVSFISFATALNALAGSELIEDVESAVVLPTLPLSPFDTADHRRTISASQAKGRCCCRRDCGNPKNSSGKEEEKALTSEEKLERNRIRNRDHSRKSRQRKKAMVERMRNQVCFRTRNIERVLSYAAV